LSLYKNDIRISREEREELIKKLIETNPITFDHNKNRTNDIHYPIYYDETYYFGDPIVLTGINEFSLNKLLDYFKIQGLKFWITYLFEMYSFEELKDRLDDIRMEDNNEERYQLFRSEINLVNEYKKGKGVIQDKTTIKDIIEATK
jgi:hypothetical protein